jgi:hypothetical protein
MMKVAQGSLPSFLSSAISSAKGRVGHGHWKGELAIGGESWRSDDLDPMAFENQHLQQVVRATSASGAQGVGVLEQIAFGPHARYGFKELIDPAK